MTADYIYREILKRNTLVSEALTPFLKGMDGRTDAEAD